MTHNAKSRDGPSRNRRRGERGRRDCGLDGLENESRPLKAWQDLNLDPSVGTRPAMWYLEVISLDSFLCL